VQRPTGHDAADLAVTQRAFDHTTGAHRVDAGADNLEQIVCECGNGSRQ
jgi:hypothetical protein